MSQSISQPNQVSPKDESREATSSASDASPEASSSNSSDYNEALYGKKEKKDKSVESSEATSSAVFNRDLVGPPTSIVTPNASFEQEQGESLEGGTSENVARNANGTLCVILLSRFRRIERCPTALLLFAIQCRSVWWCHELCRSRFRLL